MRTILFIGKGGVGKSTNACATAALAAAGGRKTLLVSSDLAHNLFDILDVQGRPGLVKASDHLTLLEVDILLEIKENWDSIQQYLADFLSYLNMDRMIAEEISLIPGMDALFLLTRILREIESSNYDVVVIDCAPTAGTLRLLSLTDSSSNKLNQIISVERSILKLVRPFGRHIKGIKQILPEDDLYITFGRVIEDIGRLGDILRDPGQSSIRLVLNPDKIAIAESKRAFTYFALFGFPVDAVMVNKLLPEELNQGYFKNWFQLQHEQMGVLEKSFLNTRILPIAHYSQEPIGLARLEEMARDVYGDLDPCDVLSDVNTIGFEKQDNQVILSMLLPNLDKSMLDIGRKDGDLLITAGTYLRILTLPDSLTKDEVTSAEYKGDTLRVTFTKKENHPT
ncbi:ArsA family ATPase [Desulfospira joergensenii]|uniref:ArsA family ATPase n=1 Tax=Desulfospira joergensenii TaxID=53329 RepID=UPI0003B67BC2|nr:ArsA family ATPase [Desulfospira joergensenii]